MTDVFISYARSTAAQAQQVGDALTALGHGVWRDDDIPAHRSWSDVIEERLSAARAVVVVWSAEAAKSQWVQSEADQARAAGKLVQLTVDGAKLPMPFDRVQCVDLTGWDGDPGAPAWRKVADSVAALTARAESRSAAAPALSAAPQHSICVLPFANMSGEAEQEYFSDGVSEDIITDLSKISALQVVSRNSAFQFKGKHVDVRQVARQLGVSHVLEGSVRKAGGRVRITAQLIDAASDSHQWAERYDRDLTDIFALQDEISQAIVAALKVKLLPAEKQAIGQRGTTNLEAYNLYLMARQYELTGNMGDPKREEMTLRLCRRALEIDPGYARAWSLTALAQSSLRFHRGRDGDDGFAAAERAIALDPDLAEPHAVKASVLAVQLRLDAAHEELDRAFALEPQSAIVNLLGGQIYLMEGRLEDSRRCYERAALFDEADFGAAGMIVSLSAALGDAEGMRRAARMCLARAEQAVAQDPSRGHAFGFGVGALAALGEKERAREWMARALVIDPDNPMVRYNMACSMSRFLHDVETAIELLTPVFEEISPALFRGLKIDPDLDLVREDPRFWPMYEAAERRIGLAGAPASPATASPA